MSRNFDSLIVGGGNSGAQTALALRDAGYGGSIGIVTAERHPPYERPPLSKDYLSGIRTEAELLLRPEAFWSRAEVDVVTERRVIRVRAGEHLAVLNDGQEVSYGKLVWATGGEPRKLNLPGADLQGVFTFRTLDDARAVKEATGSARSAVIIGGGYIGLEAAAAFRKAGLPVAVLEAQDRLLARVTGPDVSDFFLQMHRKAGVDVRLGVGVEAITGKLGRAAAVRLSGGEELAADLVLVGIGLIPNSGILAEAGAACSNGVDIDSRCRTTLSDVYAVGDVANFASEFSATGARVRLESVPNSAEHARIAAADITGTAPPAPAVPWFWSSQYNMKLQTAGLITGYGQTILRGDPSTGKFSVLYLHNGAVIGVDAINNTKDFVQGKALVAARAVVDPELAADPRLLLTDAIRTPQAAAS
ncbi:NAD(P)/FAD-dependent oxidoreductase [Arthrobacter mobilis]|uniref:FAD-dependent oxidoreductase n=1 Tax=Arthrobacter mobilis TaxID=2724944 RepID=A0A7X6K7F2_9MICC|nr:FAD-dependent oxidoreductase [Arthrobacter mobilis]NKX56548.1 FAD-dependent oxidoreductase [Arthrobacter mobilis]